MTRLIKNAIGSYVQSDGVNLPSDWEDHVVGGDMEGSCVFCKSFVLESKYIVPTLKTTDYIAPVTLQVCNECHDEITSNAAPSWFENQDYLTTGGAGHWNATIQDYIVPYVEDGILPEKIEEDALQACDFCGNECSAIYSHFSSFKNIKDGKLFKHLVPIKKNVNLIEPPVISCIRCESTIRYLSKKLSQIQSYQRILMGNCYNCNGSYPMLVEEWEARQEISLKVPMNEYVCPLCAGELWEGCQRWVTVKCTDCLTERLFDRLHKDFFKGDYPCVCKKPNNKSKSDMALTTLTFQYDIKGKRRNISINKMELLCGEVKKYVFTVVDNDVKGEDNVLHIGSKYYECEQTAEGNCGCIKVGSTKELNAHILDLHIQIIEYLEKNDSS